MKIDNSQLQAFFRCPRIWEERYGNNLEPRNRADDSLDFGTRMHQLLEERHKGLELHPLSPDPFLEAEAQMTFAAYEAFWGKEPFTVVDAEKYFEIPLGDHTYCGEMDAVVRMKDSTRLQLFETKTEKRGSKANLPAAWQQRTQVSLYLLAAETVYEEQFEGILLNVITRQSPKGECPPTFRRDPLHRSTAQKVEAARILIWVADQIEAAQQTGFFPADRNECVSRWGWPCEYLLLHQAEGRPPQEVIDVKFKQAEPYLAGL